MTHASDPTAAVLIIGNEMLSGTTVDQNLNYLAKKLYGLGIALGECRFIADDQAAIVAAVNACRAAYTYVFTTGGIGPTHDDITAASIAAAFDVPYEQNPEAARLLLEHYPATLPHTEARLRMANMPQGAKLLINTASAAPGFFIENVFVFAGIPNIMHAMFEAAEPHLARGRPYQTRIVFCPLIESYVADQLGAIQDAHKDVEIGSYPAWRMDEERGIRFILKSKNLPSLEMAHQQVCAMIKSHGVEAVPIEHT